MLLLYSYTADQLLWGSRRNARVEASYGYHRDNVTQTPIASIIHNVELTAFLLGLRRKYPSPCYREEGNNTEAFWRSCRVVCCGPGGREGQNYHLYSLIALYGRATLPGQPAPRYSGVSTVARWGGWGIWSGGFGACTLMSGIVFHTGIIALINLSPHGLIAIHLPMDHE